MSREVQTRCIAFSLTSWSSVTITIQARFKLDSSRFDSIRFDSIREPWRNCDSIREWRNLESSNRAKIERISNRIAVVTDASVVLSTREKYLPSSSLTLQSAQGGLSVLHKALQSARLAYSIDAPTKVQRLLSHSRCSFRILALLFLVYYAWVAS